MEKETYAVCYFDSENKWHDKQYKNRKSAEHFAVKVLENGVTDEVTFYVMLNGEIKEHSKCH